MKELVIRKTVNGNDSFTFDRKVSDFFVKNLSEGNPIYVTFEEDTEIAECIKIPPMFGQECKINENGNQYVDTSRYTIYVKSEADAEVEVQALDWRFNSTDKGFDRE